MIIGLPPAGAGLACSALAAVVIVRDDAPAGPRDPAATAPTVTLAAALTFTHRRDHIDVRVRDPLADPARYRAEFAAQGLKVELSLVPASPSIVGTVIIRRPWASRCHCTWPGPAIRPATPTGEVRR